MNMVWRAGKSTLPPANECSRQSDLSANAPPALIQGRTPTIWSRATIAVVGRNHLARKSASKCLAMMQMRLSRPYDSVLLQCQIGDREAICSMKFDVRNRIIAV